MLIPCMPTPACALALALPTPRASTKYLNEIYVEKITRPRVAAGGLRPTQLCSPGLLRVFSNAPYHKVFFAVCDCTGHGVPGAFVSMIGNNLLNQTISEQGIEDPGEILSTLNNGMINAFTKEGEIEANLHTETIDFSNVTFSEGQNKVIKLVKAKLKNKIKKQIKCIVHGNAGTGKSFLIAALQQILGDKVKQHKIKQNTLEQSSEIM